MIQLAHAVDGRVLLASNHDFPSKIRRVEYFRDLRLLMLSFKCGQDELMPLEVDEKLQTAVRSNAEITILQIEKEGDPPEEYTVSLVQIGL